MNLACLRGGVDSTARSNTLSSIINAYRYSFLWILHFFGTQYLQKSSKLNILALLGLLLNTFF